MSAVLATAALGSTPARSTAARQPTATPRLTASRLNVDLLAGARMMRVPRNLHPPLSRAAEAKPIIVRNGCHVGRDGMRSKPCIYGSVKSHTSVALFGDSHAAAWFPALNVISREHHWKLVDFTKDGCPPVEAEIAAWFRHGAPYWECSRWRANAMRQIAALRPAAVIVTWARWLEVPEARSLGSAWLNDMAATFRFLRRHAARVIFISDVPTLVRGAPACVAAHPSDVRWCDSTRHAAIRLPEVKKEELALATAEHVGTIDPTSWFCSPSSCPVIVNHIILYRDNAHMVPAWSRFVAPVLAASIVPIMESPTARPHLTCTAFARRAEVSRCQMAMG